MTYNRSLVRELAANDSHLRLLYAEHQAFENRLANLGSQRSLTAAEQIEIRNLQKLKLARKDEIARILARKTS